GSYWAYYELGWGGFRFWDPVENASLMPWLSATALLHSAVVMEKRDALKVWTVLLAILSFSLSLIGTFLVRSGVLTSVHAFATDPARGTFILVFLCIVIGGSLALYAWRAPTIAGGGRFDVVSRESFLLVNNLLFATLTVLVLFGTLAPLIYEAAGWGKISVGFPWFNKMFVSLSPFLIVAMGIGPLTRWKHDEPMRLVRSLWIALALGIAVFIVALQPIFEDGGLAMAFGLSMSAWLVGTHLIALAERLKNKGGFRGLAADFGARNLSYYGMWTAHVGIAVFIVGVTMVSIHGSETDVRMSPGDVHEDSGYRFQFNGVQAVPGPNYMAQQGEFIVYKDERQIAVLHPEKRSYFSGGMPMTEAAINAGFLRDLYVSLGEPVGTDGDWALRVYYKPYVRWIWLGAIFMALGGLLAMADRRYRTLRRSADVPAGALAARS
ncbi:heme lyase CcmF/NrfE family subunit, partial [Thiocapsa sp. UBA6158]|uniref:heme lyase CcmF/NrfE family subunit n=1 Tax=Thiocapsa sp. UBA6158 TaxID=1947692 RepID=UPI0025D07A3E